MVGHFFLIMFQRHLPDTVLFFHLCDNLLLDIPPPVQFLWKIWWLQQKRKKLQKTGCYLWDVYRLLIYGVSTFINWKHILVALGECLSAALLTKLTREACPKSLIWCHEAMQGDDRSFEWSDMITQWCTADRPGNLHKHTCTQCSCFSLTVILKCGEWQHLVWQQSLHSSLGVQETELTRALIIYNPNQWR